MHVLTQQIDLDAVAANTRAIKAAIGGRKLMAVVKADAYNHGALACVKVMQLSGADQFGVATFREAHALRAAGITAPILAWMWRPEQDVAAALKADIQLAVISPAHARAVIHAATETGITATVTVKVETGMGRSGVCEADWPAVFRMLAASRHIHFTGVMSHLACADERNHPHNDEQAQVFRRAISAARAAGLKPAVNHLANSPATLGRNDLFFEMIRPGIVLYGVDPAPDLPASILGLRPVMTLKAHVIVVKPISQGQPVSYGGTWTAPSDGYIATIPWGYADGFTRAWQGKLEVAINGHRYPQVGRICMDQFVVFLGDNPHNVTGGDEAYIFGPGDHGEMTAIELAEAVGTIGYEILCAPHGRIYRSFVGEAVSMLTEEDKKKPTGRTQSF